MLEDRSLSATCQAYLKERNDLHCVGSCKGNAIPAAQLRASVKLKHPSPLNHACGEPGQYVVPLLWSNTMEKQVGALAEATVLVPNLAGKAG